MLRVPVPVFAIHLFIVGPCYGSASESGRFESLEFERINRESGLSQSVVTSILQDRLGFIWFGTLDGLNRYDGYRFKIYRPDASDPSSISDQRISVLLEDRSGSLWIGTESGGLSRYDPQTEAFTNYVHQPDRPGSLSHNRVRSLLEDRLGRIWVGTANGLNRYDSESDSFRRFIRNRSPAGNGSDYGVGSICELDSGVLLIGTDEGGLFIFDPKSETFRNLPIGSGDPAGRSVLSLLKDGPNRVWVSVWGRGLWTFDPTRESLRQVEIEGASELLSRVWIMRKDREGALWLGTAGAGIVRYDPVGGQWRLTRAGAEPHHLSSGHVRALIWDASEILWIGTWGRGINKAVPKTRLFRSHIYGPEGSRTLSGSQTQAVVEDHSGTLWVGTDSGLDEIDLETKAHRRHTTDSDRLNALPDDNIKALLKDSNGRLWIGSFSGLTCLDTKTGRITAFADRSPEAPRRWRVSDLARAQDGRIWIGTPRSGLVLFEPESWEFQRYRHLKSEPKSLCHDEITALYTDSLGVLWVGTAGGLGRFDAQTGEFTNFRHDPEDLRSLSHDWVSAIHEDGEGTIWVGTYGRGLNRLDPSGSGFRRISVGDGLPNSVIYGILPDNQNRLWVSTNEGIVRYDPTSGDFTLYDVRDGLPSNEFNQGAFSKSPRGTLYFGSINGLVEVAPEEVGTDQYQPPVVLTEIIGSGHSETRSPWELRSLELPYTNQTVTLKFTSLHFRAPGKNRYSYRLGTEEWTDLGTVRELTLSQLPPGSHRLQVRGSNSDQVWSDKTLELGIMIHPPWWRLWPVQALGLVVVGLSAWAGHGLRRRRFAVEKVTFERQVARYKNALKAARKAREALLRKAQGLDDEGDYGGGRPPSWLLAVERRIQAEFRGPPTLSELAEGAKVHPNHLSRSFRQHFGLGIRRYIVLKRLEWAKEELGSGSGSIADVALAAGFTDQSHFARMFKREFGITPSQYRRVHARLEG